MAGLISREPWLRSDGEVAVEAAGSDAFHGGWRRWMLERLHLVGGDWNMNCMFQHIGNFIIRTEELIFFRGVGIPPTRHVAVGTRTILVFETHGDFGVRPIFGETSIVWV